MPNGATRWPSAIASIWPRVTYTVVVSRRARICTSLARTSNEQLGVEVCERLIHEERLRVA
jgi:hypothetical protein